MLLTALALGLTLGTASAAASAPPALFTQETSVEGITEYRLQRLLGPHPKGHPLYVPDWQEVIAEAAAVKLEQSRAFHARFYGAQSALLSVVGDFD